MGQLTRMGSQQMTAQAGKGGKSDKPLGSHKQRQEQDGRFRMLSWNSILLRGQGCGGEKVTWLREVQTHEEHLAEEGVTMVAFGLEGRTRKKMRRGPALK